MAFLVPIGIALGVSGGGLAAGVVGGLVVAGAVAGIGSAISGMVNQPKMPSTGVAPTTDQAGALAQSQLDARRRASLSSGGQTDYAGSLYGFGGSISSTGQKRTLLGQ